LDMTAKHCTLHYLFCNPSSPLLEVQQLFSASQALAPLHIQI